MSNDILSTILNEMIEQIEQNENNKVNTIDKEGETTIQELSGYITVDEILKQFDNDETIDIHKIQSTSLINCPLNTIEEDIINDLEQKKEIGIETIKNDIYIEDELEKQILEEIDKTKENKIPDRSHKSISSMKGYDSDSTCISMDSINKRLVVSILCPPQTISFLDHTLSSLYSQNIDTIYICIDEKSNHLIDDDIRERCKIILCPKYNPFNHIYQTLVREHDKQTIMICMKSGYIYPNNIEKEVRKAFKRFPPSAHSMSLMKFKSINFFDYITINGNVGDIYENDYFIAFKRDFFKSDFIEYLNIMIQLKDTYSTEELVISNYLNKYKIPIRCIFKKKCNRNLVKKLCKYECIHTLSGLNVRMIQNYCKIIQQLDRTYNLYLRNSIRVHECLQCVSSNQYPYYRY